MKILCICEGGNVRSVAMAEILKDRGNNAIAIGMQYIDKDTLLILTKWADKIIDVRDYLPKDIWSDAKNKDLIEKINKIIGELKL